MSVVYQTQGVDYDTPEQATLVVEAAGSGSVIKFLLEPNLPGRLPKLVHKSLALWTLDDGKWTARSIFGGTAEGMGEERPGSNALELRRLAATPFIAEVLTPFGHWNELGRHRSAKLAEKANTKSLKYLPNATLRVRDERAA
jgi:carboxylesterase type B